MIAVLGRPLQLTVRFLLRDHSPVFLPVLSVTLVYRGQTVGLIRMPLGVEVDLGPGRIVLDGTQLPQGKEHSSIPGVGPFLSWPNSLPPQQLLSSTSLKSVV